MRLGLASVAWRFGAFVLLCVFAAFALLAIFAQQRFERQTVYKAVFTNVSGLSGGNFVRVAGVEVGKVKKITVRPDSLVDVEFGTDPSVVLTEGSRVAIRYENPFGERFVALEEGAGSTRVLPAGGTIGVANTTPALDLDSLIGGFRPLLRALPPDQVNELTGQLISAFQGEGDSIGSLLARTASVTNTLADRDELIGQVVTNLNTVLGSLADQSGQFDKAVTSLSELVKGLASRKSEISAGLANLTGSARSVADLLSQARPPLKDAVAQTDRAAAIVVADHDYVDKILEGLPDKYRQLGRLGLYGDYFSFYLCDLTLKLNGKGGQPVYVKVAGQSTGRCEPK